MNRLIVVGGKLQGTEALYLAQKAKIPTVLIDRNPEAIARNLCDAFVCMDILDKPDDFLAILEAGDIILPALENLPILEALDSMAREVGFTLAFDLRAYLTTSSKLLSDQLFRECNLPVPLYFPEGKAPYIGKPNGESGSTGVTYLKDDDTLNAFLQALSDRENWIIQEFLEGPSYSIEVIGRPGHYKTYQITQIHMDEIYDCRMVTAPCAVTEEQQKAFEKMAVTLAEKLQLKGIMDLEVIDDQGTFKLLEIDARIPSQTPTVVYHSSGDNLILELVRLFDEGTDTEKMEKKAEGEVKLEPIQFASFEHCQIKDGIVTPHGEHIMGQAEPLVLEEKIYGSDEVLSDAYANPAEWRGTFINWAPTEEEWNRKRENFRRKLGTGEKG